MKLGAFSVSLNVKNIEVSKTFYESLGFSVFAGTIESNYLIMKNENTIIGFFQNMFEKNILTFNPGWDQNSNTLKSYTYIREIQQELKNNNIKLVTEAAEDSIGPASCIITDPDGNTILFDQHI